MLEKIHKNHKTMEKAKTKSQKRCWKEKNYKKNYYNTGTILFTNHPTIDRKWSCKNPLVWQKNDLETPIIITCQLHDLPPPSMPDNSNIFSKR